MQLRTRVGGAAIWIGVWFATGAQGHGADPWPCSSKPIEPCFKHHGRLSSQNGIALKDLADRYTCRRSGQRHRSTARIDREYLDMTSPDHSYIYGDFEICPTEHDIPGHLRRVCLAGAESLSRSTCKACDHRSGCCPRGARQER